MSVETWPHALRALIEHLAGKPAEALTWRELVEVRDRVDRLLNGEINRRQAPAGPLEVAS